MSKGEKKIKNYEKYKTVPLITIFILAFKEQRQCHAHSMSSFHLSRPAFHIEVQVQVLAAQLPIHLPANMPGTEGGSND